MADEKKDGGGLSLGQILLITLGVLFLMWIVSGGPERIENKYNPFLEPLVDPLGDGEVYGAGGNFQTGVENLLTEGTYSGWIIQAKNNFAFLTPQGWSSQDTGSFPETEFGTITNGSVTLEYQYGREVNQLNFENDPNYEIVWGAVDGEPAKFVRPKTSQGEVTGAHIRKNRRKQITIYTTEPLTPEEEQQVFEIINTVRL